MIGRGTELARERLAPGFGQVRDARRIEWIGGEGREPPDKINGERKPETREVSELRPPAGGTGRPQM